MRLIIRVRGHAKYLLISWLVVILVISSIPYLKTPEIHSGKIVIRLDHLFHMLEYGVLAVLAFLSFIGKRFAPYKNNYLITTVLLVLFAIGDEFHQKLIPGRSFNPGDIMSNITGILAGLVFCILIFRKISNRLKEGNLML